MTLTDFVTSENKPKGDWMGIEWMGLWVAPGDGGGGTSL